MDWSGAVSSAKRWASSSSLGFAVTSINEDVRKITFMAPCGSFYITVPDKVGSEEWVVWSDEDDGISALSGDMDYLTSAQHTLEQVLERSSECLTRSEGGEEESESESDGDGDSEEGDDFDAYYGEDDVDADTQDTSSPSVEKGISADDFFTGQGSPAAVHRLLADLKGFAKSDGKYGISGQPRGDNLFLWDVELSDFPKGTPFYKDLQSYATKHKKKPVIEMEMKFPKDYPMNPPFVRVIRPRFRFLTGHVTVGGSICMQMLTRSGWTPSNDIESILIQIRCEIMSDPNVRLDGSPEREYSEHEAKDAFERMVRKYGWNRVSSG